MGKGVGGVLTREDTTETLRCAGSFFNSNRTQAERQLIQAEVTPIVPGTIPGPYQTRDYKLHSH